MRRDNGEPTKLVVQLFLWMADKLELYWSVNSVYCTRTGWINYERWDTRVGLKNKGGNFEKKGHRITGTHGGTWCPKL